MRVVDSHTRSRETVEHGLGYFLGRLSANERTRREDRYYSTYIQQIPTNFGIEDSLDQFLGRLSANERTRSEDRHYLTAIHKLWRLP